MVILVYCCRTKSAVHRRKKYYFKSLFLVNFEKRPHVDSIVQMYAYPMGAVNMPSVRVPASEVSLHFEAKI